MGGSQYLRDYRMAQRLKKTVELRKRVMERNKKPNQKRDSVPFQERLKEITGLSHVRYHLYSHFVLSIIHPIHNKVLIGSALIFQHNFKKIRNNIEKSNKNKKPRCLILGGKMIIQQIFKEAFNWDQSSFSLPIHEKLTPLHLELDPPSPPACMRNHLAEDVLDQKMLFLMQINNDTKFL